MTAEIYYLLPSGTRLEAGPRAEGGPRYLRLVKAPPRQPITIRCLCCAHLHAMGGSIGASYGACLRGQYPQDPDGWPVCLDVQGVQSARTPEDLPAWLLPLAAGCPEFEHAGQVIP